MTLLEAPALVIVMYTNYDVLIVTFGGDSTMSEDKFAFCLGAEIPMDSVNLSPVDSGSRIVPFQHSKSLERRQLVSKRPCSSPWCAGGTGKYCFREY